MHSALRGVNSIAQLVSSTRMHLREREREKKDDHMKRGSLSDLERLLRLAFVERGEQDARLAGRVAADESALRAVHLFRDFRASDIRLELLRAVDDIDYRGGPDLLEVCSEVLIHE